MDTPLYWILSVSGVSLLILTEDGQKLLTESEAAILADTLDIPPDWLVRVVQTRWYLGDPPTTQFIYSTTQPDTATDGMVWTNGDGNYYHRTGTTWIKCKLQFGDGYIRVFTDAGMPPLNVAVNNIDQLIMRIDPTDYITSGNAGGQSVSFPSLAEVTAFFTAKKKALQDMILEQAGLGGVTFVRACRPAVGGSYE
jgi:hypothetical protein